MKHTAEIPPELIEHDSTVTIHGNRCTITYADGTKNHLVFRNGEWRVTRQSEIVGYSHACGYID